MLSSHHRARLVGALAAVVLPVVSAAQSSVAFTLKTSSGTGDNTAESTSRVRVRGPVMRFDAVDRAKGDDDLGKDAYTLFDATNHRIVVVMPGTKQYVEMKFDDSTATAIKTSAAVSTAIADLKVSGETLGANHYRMTTEFAEIAANSGQQRRRAKLVEEYWTSSDLRDVLDPIEQLGRTLGGKASPVQSPYAAFGGTSVNEFFTRRMEAQRRLFKGFPSKTVATSEETDAEGKVTRSVSTTEVTDVQRGDQDPALFTVPNDYTKFDAQAFFARSMKNAAIEGTKDAAKETAKDALKKGLGGFLKKKP